MLKGKTNTGWPLIFFLNSRTIQEPMKFKNNSMISRTSGRVKKMSMDNYIKLQIKNLPNLFCGLRLKSALRSNCASALRNCGMPSLALK